MTSSSQDSCSVPPTRQIPAVEWENARDEITRLYFHENKSLKEVQEVLYRSKNFHASPWQYKTKFKEWSVEKIIGPRAMALMIRKLRTRKREQGKETIFFMHGKEVNKFKIEDWSRRNPLSDSMYGLRDTDDIPEYIEACTPEPEEHTTVSTAKKKRYQSKYRKDESRAILQTLDTIRQEIPLHKYRPLASLPTPDTIRRDNREQVGIPGLGRAAITSTPLSEAGDFTSAIMPDSVQTLNNKPTSESRYRQVKVLLLYWEDYTAGGSNMEELEVIASKFEVSLNFPSETWKIPNKRGDLEVACKLLDFVNGATNEDLLIVYYAGEGKLTKDGQLTWTSPIRDKQGNHHSVKWSGVRYTLEAVESDVLILLGCCAPLATGSNTGHGVTDIVAACAFETPDSSKPFTSSLSHALRELCSQSRSFTVASLYSRILLHYQEQWYGGDKSLKTSPVHISLVKDPSSSRSIIISPLKQPKEHRMMLPLIGIPSASESSMCHPVSQFPGPSEIFVPKKRPSDQIVSAASPSAPLDNDSGAVRARKPVKRTRKDSGHFQCTFQGCNRFFSRVTDWKRHEEHVHWPMRNWECRLCSETTGFGMREPSVFSRRDKLYYHIAQKHDQRPDHANIELWSQEVFSAWPKVCGFCGTQFTSRTERAQHVAQHFRHGQDMKDWKIPWEGPENQRSQEDDEDDDAHDFSGTIRRGSSYEEETANMN